MAGRYSKQNELLPNGDYLPNKAIKTIKTM